MLTPHAEFMATFLNEDNEPEPRLRCCCMQEQVRIGNSMSSASHTNGHKASHCNSDPLMAPKWSVRLQVSGTDHDGTVATEVDGEDVTTDCSYRHVQGTPHCALVRQASNGTTPGVPTADEAPTSSYRKRKVDQALPGEPMEMSDCPMQPSPLSLAPPQCPHLQVQYVREDQKEGATLLDSWKEVFSSVWEMRCAVPGAPAIPGITPRTHRKIVLETQRRSNSEDSRLV